VSAMRSEKVATAPIEGTTSSRTLESGAGTALGKPVRATLVRILQVREGVTRAEAFGAVSALATGDGWTAQATSGDTLMFVKTVGDTQLRLGASFDDTTKPPELGLTIVGSP